MKKISIIFILVATFIYVLAQTNTTAASVARGKIVYTKVCLSCHMVDGGGVPHLNPPLTVPEYINNKNKMIAIVLKGFADRIPIDEEYYGNNMAPHNDLTNQQIADVLTYVRNNFGNKAGAVTLADVKAVRNPVKKKS